MPGLISAFILSHILKRKGHIGLTIDVKNTKEVDSATEVENDHVNPTASIETEVNLDGDVTLENAMIPKKDSCNGDYGGEKGNEVKSGGCGGCGAECGNMVKSGGCGGCSAGCSGGCGSGCGGGCGSMVNSSGCGAGCGGGCGSRVNSSGCGGCGGCGAGCGSRVKSTGCGGCSLSCGDDIDGGEPGNLVISNGCEKPIYMEEAVKA